MKESALQDFVKSRIREGIFSQVIVGREVLSTGNDGTIFPEFPVDYLARKKALTAAGFVLEQLDNIAVLNETPQNISLDRKERLLPDFVLFNPKKYSFVIVELKTSRKPEREAITELTGYEHELRNQFPFLSSYDVSFVLIATEYSSLLTHSVSSLITWGGKNVLCLRAESSDAGVVLRIELPAPWSAMGQDGLPRLGLLTGSILIESDAVGQEPPATFIERAFEILVHDGERARAHGFALLSRMTHLHSEASFMITVGVLNPFAFVEHAKSRGFRTDATLHRKIFEPDPVSTSMQPVGLFAISERACRLLEEKSKIRWDLLSAWDVQRNAMIKSTLPLKIDFFGSLAEHVHEIVLSPGIRSRVMGISFAGLDWKLPHIGLPILDKICGCYLFRNGSFSCEQLTAFGILLGAACSLSKTVNSHSVDPNALPWRGIAAWYEVSLRNAIAEIHDHFYAMRHKPTAPLDLYCDDLFFGELRCDALLTFGGWFEREFIGEDHPIHREFFLRGLEFHCALDPFLRDALNPPTRALLDCGVADFSRTVLVQRFLPALNDVERGTELRDEILKRYFGDSDAIPDNISTAIKALSDEAHVKRAARDLPELIDVVTLPMLHELIPAALGGVDWAWLRQELLKRRAEGLTDIGVILGADGNIGIGHIEPPYPKLNDPVAEVLLRDDRTGISWIKTTLWDDLIHEFDRDSAPPAASLRH